MRRAPGMTAANASCSACGMSASRSPQSSRVGARICPSPGGIPAASAPARAARQTRAGSFRLSRTTVSRKAGGTGRARVPAWNSRAKPGATGSARMATSSHSACATGLPRRAR